MIPRFYILFLVGIVLVVLAAFIDWGVLPWLVGGTGVVLGFTTAGDEELAPRAFWGSLGLVIALTAIHLQTFNPEWLSSLVFFARVFFAHVLLVMAGARFLQLAKNAQ